MLRQDRCVSAVEFLHTSEWTEFSHVCLPHISKDDVFFSKLLSLQESLMIGIKESSLGHFLSENVYFYIISITSLEEIVNSNLPNPVEDVQCQSGVNHIYEGIK